MRRALLILAILSEIGFLSVGPAAGGPPIAFDLWGTNQNNNIEAQCAQGFSCSNLMQSPGFLQRTIIDQRTQQQFFQTIITSPTTTSFSDESFVLVTGAGPAGTGIAFKSSINPGDLTLVTTNQTGWAATPNSPTLIVDQKVKEINEFGKQDFTSNFNFQQIASTTGTVSGSKMQMLQSNDIESTTNNIGELIRGTNDDKKFTSTEFRTGVQHFAQFEASGSFLQAGTAEFKDSPTSGGKTNTVSWGGGGWLKLSWIGLWADLGVNPHNGQPSSRLENKWGRVAWDMNPNDESENRTVNKNDVAFWSRFPMPLPSLIPQEPFPGRIINPTGGPQLSFGSITVNVNGTPASRPTDGTSTEGGPIGFANWTAQNGKITVSCPSGFTCNADPNFASITDDGFLMRQITDNRTGKSFFQTILVDRGASGNSSTLDFSSESVVNRPPQNTNNTVEDSGIASRQVTQGSVLTPNGLQNTLDVSILRTGWAKQPGLASIELFQSSDLNSGIFRYTGNNDPITGARTGFRLEIDQIATNADEKLKDQTWFFREAAGDMQRTSGSVELWNKETLTWRVGDDLKGNILWQSFDAQGGKLKEAPNILEGDGFNDGWGGAKYGQIAYDVVGDGKEQIDLVSPSWPVLDLWMSDALGPVPFVPTQ